MTSKKITLNAFKNNLKRITLNQYEHNVGQLKFELLCDDSKLDLSLFDEIRFYAKKPDSTIIGTACTVEGKNVILPVPSQLTAVDGIAECTIECCNSEGNIRFGGLTIEIIPSHDSDDAIVSTDEFTLLETTILEAKKIIEQGVATDEQVVNAVEDYFEENPEIQEGKSAYDIAVKNGFEGSEKEWIESLKGEQGESGSDYILSDSDKSEIATAVKADLTQLEPLFANSIEECTDISKVYVLPDGYIYAYMATATEGTSTPNFTNLMDDPNAYIKEGYRYSHSGQAFKEQATDCSIVIPIPSGNPVIRVRGAGNDATYNNYVYVSYDTDDGTYEVTPNYTRTVESNGDIVITINATLSSTGYATFAVASGVDIDDLIVTVNEEISYTATEGGVVYDWKNTGHAFIPTDYEDRIIDIESEVKANGDKISELENEINKPAPTGIVTMFISPTGDDSNDGLTASYPKKTVKACVEAGATRISAKRGTYNEEISLSNIDTLEIFPTDNNYTNKDVHRYPPIVFDTSDTIAVDSLVDYNAIKSVAYSKQNKAFSYVFTNGLYDTVYSTIHGYHSVIWLITNNIKTDKKLRPVASISEVESNADTFTYIDNTIYLNADLTNVQEIRVPTSYNNAFTVSTANKVKLTEVEINFAGRYNLFIENCPVVEIDNCSVKYSSNGSGFDLKSANGILRNCYASRVHDGYGIGGCGHTIFIDCTAEWCFDDGMSHHTKCTGTVIGGRFEGNRKGGNVPAYGANVNIYGGLYKDNQMYGIAYMTDSTHNPSTGMVQNAVIVGNDKGLVVSDTCNVTALNCSYSDNNSDKDITGELIEY